eukprot:1136301-Pelagomonas_calceolata.AAC.3
MVLAPRLPQRHRLLACAHLLRGCATLQCKFACLTGYCAHACVGRHHPWWLCSKLTNSAFHPAYLRKINLFPSIVLGRDSDNSALLACWHVRFADNAPVSTALAQSPTPCLLTQMGACVCRHRAGQAQRPQRPQYAPQSTGLQHRHLGVG